MSTDYQRIILIGYRATGKSSTAKALADKLDWRWTDSDAELAKKEGRPIARIFKDDGEPEFRRLESAILVDLLEEKNVVIATGGGSILAASNRELLKTAGLVIWLTAAAEVIQNRLAADSATTIQRPPLLGRSVIDEVHTLLEKRHSIYKECADFEIATDGLTPAEVADRIAARL